MTTQAEKQFVIGSRNLFVTKMKSSCSDIELGTSMRDALLFEESEAIQVLNKITDTNPSYISSLRITFIGSKIKSSDASRINSSIRSAVHFASSHLEELADLKFLQKEWNRFDPKLWLFEKGLHGIVIHLTRLNIDGNTFPKFWDSICHKEAIGFFAVLRGVSLNLITKGQINEAMNDTTKYINLNKLIPAVMNRVEQFAPDFRIDSRKRNNRFIYTDSTSCTAGNCSSLAISNRCWIHALIPNQTGVADNA